MFEQGLFMLRYLSLFLLFSMCIFAENTGNKTVFKTDRNQNLVVQDRPAEESKNLSEEITKEYKPVEYKWAFLKMLFWLAVLIVFFILTFHMFKKMSLSRINTANQNKMIKILEKRALSPKTVVYLVEYDNKKMLIGESQNELKIHYLKSEE